MHLATDTSSNSHFASVPNISKPRNAFSIAERHLTTIQFDYLYPIMVKNIYPGDTLSIAFDMMARLQTQGWTLYDDLIFDIHAWFCPYRLVQSDWARFQFNAQPTGPTQDNSALTTPSIDLTGMTTGFASKSLYDYLGYPTLINQAASGQHMHNYYARIYNKIWNDNYRDENLQNAVVVDYDNGPDNPSDYVLLKRGKRHDVFTSALPFAQKGAAVTIPLGSSAPVRGIGVDSGSVTTASISNARMSGESTPRNLTNPYRDATGSNAGFVMETTGSNGYPVLWADLSLASAATVNQWRQSIAVQHLLEADARGGTRDVESIQHRWGVTVPDFRLQRPEYLGGQAFTFDGHVVPQTSETATTPQGNLTQFSQAMNRFNVTHSFVEHGCFMILMSLRSNLTYQQGLWRELSMRTRYDFYQPEFANLGEVAVLNKEIYFQGTSADDNTFGFQEYAYQMRYGLNRVSAEMRSNYPQSLDMKHMAADYSSLPTLAAGFIQSNTPIGRNIVVQPNLADPVELSCMARGTIARTLPMYSIPGLRRL